MEWGIFSGKVLYDKVNEKEDVKKVDTDNNKNEVNDNKNNDKEISQAVKSDASFEELTPLFDEYLWAFKNGFGTRIEGEAGSFTDSDYAFFAFSCCGYFTTHKVSEELYRYFDVKSFDVKKANEEIAKTLLINQDFVTTYGEGNYDFPELGIDLDLIDYEKPVVTTEGEYYVVTYDAYKYNYDTSNMDYAGKKKYYLKYNSESGYYNVIKISPVE